MIVWFLLGWLIVALVVCAVWSRIGRNRSHVLPHRPAPDAAPLPGPRHRVADAHTASVSATEIRAALEEQSRRRQQTMHARAAQEGR